MAQYIKTEEGYKKLATCTNDKMDKFDPVGMGSFSMGRKAGTVVGVNSHAEGIDTTASGLFSHAEGFNTTASGEDSHAEGNGTEASGGYSHAEGNGTTASRDASHAEGYETSASGFYSHAEGTNTTASEHYSHAEGDSTTASGQSSHAEGNSSTAFSSVVTTTNPTTADIINVWKNKKFSVAKGLSSHVEGEDNLALNDYSHAEGCQTTASGFASHAEGGGTTANGFDSHAEGGGTTASGDYSHAEGNNTTASQSYSHAEGYQTRASGYYSHAQGKYNIEDTSNKYADIIGNGTTTKRSNAATVDWKGNAWFAGDVYTGSTSGTNKDNGSKKLATEEYVNSSIAAGGTDISLGLTSAAVGQTIKVKAVDASGKPTVWEAADMPTGEEDFELIFSDTITEDANGFVRTVDKDGNTFELKEAVVIVYTVPFESSTSNVGRGVGFLPSSVWGRNCAASISNSIPADSSLIARYDVVHVKVVQGYQCLIDRWESQNGTNVRGVMMRNNTAGQVPINFKYGDDVTAIGELSNSQGNLTCVKIVSYGTCMAKGDVVILYGKRV